MSQPKAEILTKFDKSLGNKFEYYFLLVRALCFYALKVL